MRLGARANYNLHDWQMGIGKSHWIIGYHKTIGCSETDAIEQRMVVH
jgi:hypothetical protein